MKKNYKTKNRKNKPKFKYVKNMRGFFFFKKMLFLIFKKIFLFNGHINHAFLSKK